MRWSYFPTALPWLWRFLRAGSSVAKLRRTAAALRPLVADCPARHRALAEEAGVVHLIKQAGLLYIFPNAPISPPKSCPGTCAATTASNGPS